MPLGAARTSVVIPGLALVHETFPMRRLSLSAVAALSVLSVSLLGCGVAEEAAAPPRAAAGNEGRPAMVDPASIQPAAGMRFGIDAGAIERFTEQAGPPEYATVWVGKWNLHHGWKDTGAALQAIKA